MKPLSIKKDLICLHIKHIVLYFSNLFFLNKTINIIQTQILAHQPHKAITIYKRLVIVKILAPLPKKKKEKKKCSPTGMVKPVRVLSMGQTNMLENICIRQEYFKP